ncbi:hypothetical protein ACJ73_09586, partial [Blastomyces percursus]
MQTPLEEPLLNGRLEFERACKVTDILVKQKKVPKESGDTFLKAIELCDKITRTYHLVSGSESCYFQAKDSLIKENFEVIENTEPIFFKKMSFTDFDSYKFEYPISCRLESERSSWDHCEIVEGDICNLTHTALLFEYGGWHDERRRHDVGMPHEFQGSSSDRYEWRAPIMRGQDNVPHTIVTSYHVTDSLEPILR